MKRLIIMALAAIGLAACTTGNKGGETTDAAQDSVQKVLVLYYSQTGATKAVAEELTAQLGADIEALEVEEPYTGTFEETIERYKQEQEAGTLPTLKALQSNVADYDVIFLGYPVWFGTYASPVAALLKQQSFEGKKVVTFCTFGSGGLQSSSDDVRKALPKAQVEEGYGVRGVRLDAVSEELNRWLIEHGYKAGEVEALPAFMEHHPVSDEERAIFDQACADYQFPLGTPVDVAGRETATATDYEFTAQSTTPDGQAAQSTIYVTLPKQEGAKAVFTQVVR